jgi:hypothetical protein
MVHRVAGERPQENVVDHDEERGEAPDAVKPCEPS